VVTSFNSLHDFLHMGGYAVYLWPTYGVVLFSLVINAILSKRRLTKLLQKP